MKRISIVFMSIVVLLNLSVNAQIKEEGLRRQAQQHMQSGKYGEAIDLLNKFISANGRYAEGYNLRALCHEQRQQYSYAVLDFRRAIKLDPSNGEYKKNLDRVIKVWYELLDKKIEGHKRNIAINPNNAFDYLEIGKSHRWKEEWKLAEEWYDQYLARDDNASPDEIIRYTEILAKTGSILKGERILKIYVERYPDDWRLWSRYGYFTLWLGKNKIAEDAFLKSLSFKPFFKEAEDGLDLARRDAYVTQYQGKAFERVYPIDHYYSVIKRNPNDEESRFRLVNELIINNRLEEAYEQLQYLKPNNEGTERFTEQWDKVNQYRNEKYAQKIDEYQERLNQNPNDAEAVRGMAEYYSILQNYEQAEDVLSNYLNAVPNDAETRYLYAQILTYQNRYEEAYPEVIKVLEDDPSMTKAKLMAGQLSTWMDNDLDTGQRHLEEYLAVNPNDINALITLGTLLFQKQEYDAAEAYAAQAAQIDDQNLDLGQLNSMLLAVRLRQEEDRMMEQLNIGRNLSIDGDCDSAIPYYEDYIEKQSPTNELMYEMAEVYLCAKRYDDAINLYDQILQSGYDKDVDIQKSKVYYWSGDSLRAYEEFSRLALDYPDDVEVQLYLGDCNVKLGEYATARKIYEGIRDKAPESFNIDQRIGWLPSEPGSLSDFTNYFFSYMILNPMAYIFTDNLNFEYYYGGLGLEIGITKWMSLGATWIRGAFSNQDYKVYYTTLKGNIFIRPAKDWMLYGQFGRMKSPGLIDQPEVNFGLQYTPETNFKFDVSYLRSDGAVVLYSPYLVGQRIIGSSFKINASYRFNSTAEISGYYQLISTSNYSQVSTSDYYPDNLGNNIQLRIGKAFYPNLRLGYEYFYSDYKYTFATLYYSPQNFDSHSIWAVWDVLDEDKWEVTIGGKVGYVPSADYILREANIQIYYTMFERLKLSAYGFVGSSVRDSYGYSSGSFIISAFWTLF